MKAEVHRNLGKFEESRELLNRINDPQIVWVKDKFLQEINNQNKRVIHNWNKHRMKVRQNPAYNDLYINRMR